MSTNFAPLFAKGITKHLFDELQAVDPVVDRIFHVKTMTDPYSDDQIWELYAGPSTRLPLAPIPQGSFAPSFSKRYIPVMYALGDVIAKEHWDDDPSGVLHRLIPAKGGALARSFATARERIGAEMFMYAGYATGSVFGSPDGVALFSTAHPMSASNPGTTWSNRPSTDVDLSHTAWNAMRANLVQQMAPNNYTIVDNAPALLVVNPSQHTIAVRLTQQEWEPGTQNRDINVARLDRVQLIEWPYFRYPANTWKAWFVVGKTHFLKWFDRTQFTLESSYDIDILAYKFVAYMRVVCGWTDARGTYGSLGGA